MSNGNSKRSWRVVGGFHQVGEVVVIVTAPNWQGGLRKAALAIKGLPQMKGRRITVGSFTIQEIPVVPVVADPTQLSLNQPPVNEQASEPQGLPSGEPGSTD